MYVLKVADKEYKIRYNHAVLGETDILDRVLEVTTGSDNKPSLAVKLVAELLLAGLQKFHADEFGYETDSEKKEQLAKVYDLLDDYCEESTGKKKNSSYKLFSDLQEELGKNGFLSGLM